MRRLLMVLGLVLVLGISLAAPAYAQSRDPFDPAFTPAQPGSQPQGENGSDPGTEAPPQAPAPNFENLPNTGGDTMSWWVLAYALLASGATALLVAWSRRPIPIR